MTNAQLLFVVILIQQGLFALVWTLAARLGLSPRAAREWALATGLVTGAMTLMLLRGHASPWLTVALANLALVATFAALHRGVQRFVRRAPADREHAVVLGLAALGLLGAVGAGSDMLPVVLVTSATMGWTSLRTAFEVRRGLQAEFGLPAARWCALPPALVGVLFVIRGLLAPVFPERFAAAIDGAGPANTTLVFVIMICGLLLNTALLAMVVLRLVRRLQFQSDHDMLTGLLGRRPMERLIRAEAARCRRSGTPYALLSIDIDHFKRINDRYGHAAGDLVLARVARALHDAARAEDSVARMGGEEFCVLLPGADPAGARMAAERLRQQVRGLVHADADPPLQVTVSIGVAAVEGTDEPLPGLLRRLDRALYAAKAAGRDRVWLASPAADEAAPAVTHPAALPPQAAAQREAPTLH